MTYEITLSRKLWHQTKEDRISLTVIENEKSEPQPVLNFKNNGNGQGRNGCTSLPYTS
jgi:hypothetical protein